MSETHLSETESAPATPGYAESMAEINTILAQLETADLDIDALALLVERATHHIDNCRSRLTAAEASVTRIVGQLETPGQIK